MKKVQRLLKGGKDDRAVAEVVGAVLIFAIVISLFTTFMLWYVPTTATSNENTYQLNIMSSFTGLESQLHSGTPSVGDGISQNVHLGIAGVPPFSPSQDTEIFYSHGSKEFSSVSSFKINLNYTFLTTNRTANQTITASAYSAGEIGSYGNTQFILPVSYYVQDGILIRDSPQVSSVAGNGPLPVSAGNSSGGVYLSSSTYNITGTDVSTSSVGTSLLTLQYTNITSLKFTKGGQAVINGSEVVINSISLLNFYYNITSASFHKAIFDSFYQHYNNSTSIAAPLGLTSWNFSGLPLDATLSGNTVIIASTGSGIGLNSFQSAFYELRLSNL